jgi:hypothetical protein
MTRNHVIFKALLTRRRNKAAREGVQSPRTAEERERQSEKLEPQI